MSDESRYLKVDDLDHPMTMMITNIKKEIVDGRPRLVLYFAETEKGLLLTRELANEISDVLGKSQMVEEFFATEGGLQ